ncbi:MAG: DUF512 domain-containing protein [Fimbriimonadaceae bacterium]|nr:DUF512 domain-containing protein [Fimbriimonadaceae bacterium]
MAEIEPGSIADQLGWQPGDRLLRINGEPPRDLIDYQLWTAVEELELLVATAGEEVVFELEKDPDEDLGVRFEDALFTPLRTCNNGCLFCFVVQAPPGLRPTVYVKDDDYRLSFLGGHFTTLTNLTEPHFERILNQHLSPLYVSVHASDPALRRVLLDNQKANLGWDYLVRLVAAGIECHTQIVLCPGVNDGPALDQTIGDLAALGELIRSIGVVPVGLTRYQQHPLMRAMQAAEAHATLAQIETWRARLDDGELRRVYAADELFLMAGLPQPPAAYYDEFAQVENGVGQTRLWDDAVAELLPRLPRRVTPAQRALWLTGGYGAQLLPPFVAALRAVEGLTIDLHPIRNDLFGGNVECSGLLCAQDILAQTAPPGDLTTVLLPGRAVNENGLLLDDLTPADLAARLGAAVRPCLTPQDVVTALGVRLRTTR